MESIYDRLSEFIEADETVAVATIIDVKGSVPREVGAKMIIHPLGRHVGTVGGGCGEADVIKAALDVIQTGEPATVRVDLTEDISMQALGVCGGIMDVFVERAARQTKDERPKTNDPFVRRPSSVVRRLRSPRLHPRPRTGRAGNRHRWPECRARSCGLARQAASGHARPGRAGATRHRRRAGCAARPPASTTALCRVQGQESGRSRAATQPSVPSFVEVQRRAPELFIVGAGHIAMPLAQIAGLCDFSVTVLDDRPSFANQARFPTARQVIAAPLRETVRDLPMDADTFIVLVTRGHSQDVECLLEVLDRPVAYIGMIGSQRRVDAVFELLETEMGIDPVKFDRVYAPIGIAIGARTPAEIAVCITAEMINVLRGGPAVSISDRRRERDRRRRERESGRMGESANGK